MILLSVALSAALAASASVTKVYTPPVVAGNPCDSQASGTFPDVVVFDGHVWCAVDLGLSLAIVEVDDNVRVLRRIDRPLSERGLAFPRFGVAGGKLWLAYRDGSTGYLLDLTGGGEPASLGLVGGNDPFVTGNGYFAY